LFVEGQTEQHILSRLACELCGWDNLSYLWYRCHNDRLFFAGQQDNPSATHHLAIYNCEGDESVAFRLRERYTHLVDEGTSLFLLLRDLYPTRADRAEAPEVLSLMRQFLPSGPPLPICVLAVMEIEAWFFAEYHHFARLDASLTPERIHELTDFHPVLGDCETIAHPAPLLDTVYRTIPGRSYTKRAAQSAAVAEWLNYDHLTGVLAVRYPDTIGSVVNTLFDFLST